MTTKQALYALIDELHEQDLESAAAFLEFLRVRAHNADVELQCREAARREAEVAADPNLRVLRSTPVDDEPTTAEEDARADAAWAESRRGDTVSSDIARRSFTAEP